MKTGASGGDEGCIPEIRDYRFPRKEKLKGRDDIREVFSRKKAVSCSGAKLFVRLNGLPYNRIAFTFPRKYGTAVERNYSRRLSREVYRLLRNDLRKGHDLVVLVYPGCDNYKARTDQLRALFSRAGLFSSVPKTPALQGIQEPS